MPPLYSFLLLAGGASSRMGSNKVWMELAGQPLIERIARRVIPLAAEVIFSAPSTERLRALAGSLPIPTQIVADHFAGAGPLAGLQAGLSVSISPLMFVLAADMPFVSLQLLEALAAHAPEFDVVVPSRDDQDEVRLEPLHSLYGKNCLPAITRHLELGHRRVVSFFPEVRVRVLSPELVRELDPDLRSFFNANTPAEWQLAQEMAASEAAMPKPQHTE
jgi:molybdenum cofactor guanylyltransferase